MNDIFKAAAAAFLAISASTTVHAQDADIGSGLYRQYCASCHGIDANGDGPLAALLTAEVPNLTGLSGRNDGVFPMLNVIHIIDGRTGVRGHGGSMPTYGDVFMAQTGTELDVYGNVLATRGRVMSLAMYLESIQK